MKQLCFLVIAFFLLGCQEKTFADDITLMYPKDEKLSFQKFNEGVGEEGIGIIYIGKEISRVDVKYFKSIISAPPSPPGNKIDNVQYRNPKWFSRYFHNSFDRMKYSKNPTIFDSLSEKNVKIIAKVQDTIPKYAFNFESEKFKKYKAFPVFIKNISGRKLIMPDLKNLSPAFLNDNNKWQLIRNDNSMAGCYVGWEKHFYWELKPDEIMILSVNFLTGKSKGKFKIWSGNSFSNVFTMNYDKLTVRNQRKYIEVK